MLSCRRTTKASSNIMIISQRGRPSIRVLVPQETHFNHHHHHHHCRGYHRHHHALQLQSNETTKIAIAMSGGVDSSVAALLVQNQTQNQIQNQNQNNQSHSQLVAVHMSNWDTYDEDDSKLFCSQDQDWKDAIAVANHLNLPLLPTKFVSDYWTQVFEPFSQGVAQGHRPNPDIGCNRYIKFGSLLDYCQQTLQCHYLVTGHYARLWHPPTSSSSSFMLQNTTANLAMEECLQELSTSSTTTTTTTTTNAMELADWIITQQQQHHHNPLLLAAMDRSKCQSFFLSMVPPTSFSKVYFPLGDYYKSNNNNNNSNNNHHNHDSSSLNTIIPTPPTQPPPPPPTTTTTTTTVREMAQQAQLPTAYKRDSMGICFIGKRPGGFAHFIHQYFPLDKDDDPYNTFIMEYRNIETGERIESYGPKSESHLNYRIYTRGQRAKIGGARQKWFVVAPTQQQQQQHDENNKNKIVWVCPGTHHPALYADTMYILQDQMHWMLNDFMNQFFLQDQGNTRKNPKIFHAKCRIRNLQPLVDCRITLVQDENNHNNHKKKNGGWSYKVETVHPLRAITPGQHLAVYIGLDGLICLGGGPICNHGPSYFEQSKELTHLHPSGHNDLSTQQQHQ